MPTVHLLGLGFADLDVTQAVQRLASRPPGAPFGYVVTPNADHLVRLARQPDLRHAYENAWLRLLDSRVVACGARLLGLQAPCIVPGADLTARLFAAHLPPDEPITIIGLRPAWLVSLQQRYGCARIAHYDPPIGFEHDETAFRQAINFALANPARFTFIATGSPRQEKLAAAIAERGQGRGLGLCIGASLDFLAGASRRAPHWMQQAGLEWLHRLAADPRRLARRYLWEDPAIFRLLLRERRRRA